jgi:hypothetical protein
VCIAELLEQTEVLAVSPLSANPKGSGKNRA